jgi:outer membrane protein assembly factor BamE
MMPTDRFPGLRRTLTTLLALALATALAACVYRPTIQQGNLLQTDDIDQVKPGMTRSQVRYILGTPMVSDPFEPNRWDYVYSLQQGRSKHVDRSHFVVYFEGDKVSHVENRDAPEETETQKVIRKQREAAAAAEAAGKAGQSPATSSPATSSPATATPGATPAPEAQLPPKPPASTQPPGGG